MFGSRLSTLAPALAQLLRYRRQDLGGDVVAGITVAVMYVPQGMAYAILAGLPPVVGLYAATIPLLVYGLLGSSPQLAVGPVAVVSLMVYTACSGLAEPGSPEYIGLAALLALFVGVIMLATGLRICGIKIFPIVNMLPALVLVMPGGLLKAMITRSSRGRISLPSTVTRSSEPTVMPAWAGRPLTWTRPLAISSSAFLRLVTPEAAI